MVELRRRERTDHRAGIKKPAGRLPNTKRLDAGQNDVRTLGSQSVAAGT